jgi:hypothetical protein
MKKLKNLLFAGVVFFSFTFGVAPTMQNDSATVFANPQEASFFSNFSLKALGNKQYKLKFTTADKTKVGVNVGELNSKNLTTVEDEKVNTQHEIVLDGLSKDKQYLAVLAVTIGKTSYSETVYLYPKSGQVKVISHEVPFAEQTAISDVGINSHSTSESEPNNYFEDADYLAPATPGYGKIGYSGDVDYWYVDATRYKPNGKLNVFLDVPADKDYELTVYSNTGSYLGGSYGGTGADELVSLTGISPGEFYVKVEGYNGAYSDTVSYMVRWKFYPDVAWPVPGSNTITDRFGSTVNRTTPHNGLDIGTWGSGQISWKYEIQSVYSGNVIAAGWESTMGYYVIVNHGSYNGKAIRARYMHMESSALVSAGATVNQSQRIGWMGSTGSADGKHLHIDFYDGTSYYDPETFLASPHQNEVVDYWENNAGLKQ